MPAKPIRLNTKKIEHYISVGYRDKDWYLDCEGLFKELFGEDKVKLVCMLFAATSINTSMKSNITLFRRALYEIENDLPIGKYLPNIQQQLRQIRAAGKDLTGDELTGRKIRSYARAMFGDPNAVVVDLWLLRAFGQERIYVYKSGENKGLKKPLSASTQQYDKIEDWVRRRAKKMGIQPRQLSSIIWAGCRIATSGDTETHYKLRLRNALQNLFGVI